MKRLLLIRGLPGSGKTTLAKQLLAHKFKCDPKASAIHLEADMLLEDAEGNYHWTFDKFKQAHNWCFQKTREAMEKGTELIIVSNCFVHKESMARYKSIAAVMGYSVDLIVSGGKYESIHPIPPNIYQSMKSHWEN